MPDYKKRVRREIFRLRASMTDEELFSSDAFLSYLQDLTDAALSGTGRAVKVERLVSDREAAYTDGTGIRINTAGPLVDPSAPRVEKYLSILGETIHEIGHVLFTDFAAQTVHMQEQLAGRWYPEPPPEDGDRAMEREWEEDPAFFRLFCSTLSKVRNITEDIYVEHRLEEVFSGVFIDGLRRVGAVIRERALPVERQLADPSLSPLEITVSQLLQRARFGQEKTEDPAVRERPEAQPVFRTLDRLSPFCSRLRTERDSGQRCRLLNGMMTELAPLIREAAQQGKREMEVPFCGEAGGLLPGCAAPPAWNGPLRERLPLPVSADALAGRLAEELAVRAAEEDHLSDLSAEARSILTDVRARDRNDPSADAGYRRSHSVRPENIRVHRPPAVTEKDRDAYGELERETAALAARTLRLLESASLLRLPEGKRTGLLLGRHLSPSSLRRTDGRIFSSFSEPDGTPDLCVCVLVDESGSMGACDRSVFAARTAVLLETVFRRMLDEGSYAVIGHTADIGCGSRTLDLFPYVDFDKVSSLDRYRLSQICPRDQNRDSDAVRYCCERLLRRGENQKLLIVITDGVPLAIDYGGEEADRELSATAEEYRRKGIRILAASIGDAATAAAVQRIYGEKHTLDCSDLSALPSRLAGIVRRCLSRALPDP